MSIDNTQKNILKNINYPADFRSFSIDELKILADNVRTDLINSISKTGGHLGAGLGVVELTIALHYIFNTPIDKLIWDVGHQSYPHKILTGRKEQVNTIRTAGGLSGFCKPSESKYDAFGAGHSSTSISAALGMAVARDLKNEDNEVIAIIGDGAISAGMAYEALNNAGALKKRLIVILNDNDMSIAPPTGAMSAYLSRLISSHPYRSFRDISKAVVSKFPDSLQNLAKNAEKYARGMATGGTFFEELGMYYVGAIDGHNLDHLIPILKNIRDEKDGKPVFIHIVTQKGKGYAPAEKAKDRFHGVGAFNVKTGEKASVKSVKSYTDIFSETLIKAAKIDNRIVAITAAMDNGTGLDKFAEKFPKRMFDVAIAEQHAVTFAAAMAMEGLKPFVAIYSTFLQRGYDQIIHDCAIQNLPVKFAIDRAGIVGADGETHGGFFDIAYLSCIPNMALMAAADGEDLKNMVYFAANYNDSPIAFRYPRGDIFTLAKNDSASETIQLGKGRVIRRGKNIAILSYGTRLKACIQASEILANKHNINITIADARFAKPLDNILLNDLANNHQIIYTIEEGVTGGFASQILHYFAKNNHNNVTIIPLTLPDKFLPHGNAEDIYEDAGLGVNAIIAKIREDIST